MIGYITKNTHLTSVQRSKAINGHLKKCPVRTQIVKTETKLKEGEDDSKGGLKTIFQRGSKFRSSFAKSKFSDYFHKVQPELWMITLYQFIAAKNAAPQNIRQNQLHIILS